MPRGVLPVPRPAARSVPGWIDMDLEDAYAEALALAATEDERPRPMSQYATDPVAFCVDILGVRPETLHWSSLPEYAQHRWDGDLDPLVQALEAIARREWTAIESATGTGKTFLMAAALLWHCGCFEDSITTTVATKEDQMAKGVWREVGRLWPRFQAAFPQAELSTLRIRMDPPRGDAWGAWGITARQTAGEESNTSVQGLHAQYLLILVDEMPGVPASVVTALENTATDPGNVIAGFGNPDADTDPLARFRKKARVKGLRVSGYDHPNVVTGRTIVPGAVSRVSIAQRRDDYGEESPLYKSRVRGIAPAQSAHALIHRAWIDQAVERWRVWRASGALTGYPFAFGVDPANSDAGDYAAIARWQGPMCVDITAKPCPNANDLGAAVWEEAVAVRADPRAIGVDAIGVGAGTVNEMSRLAAGGPTCTSLHSGGKAVQRAQKAGEGEGWVTDVNRFHNLRAQMYWQFREDLRNGRIALPPDTQIVEELTQPQYGIRNGRVVVEPKDDIKSRIGRSPNKADALVYGNWVRPRERPLPSATLPDNAEDHDLGLVRGQNGPRPRKLREAIADRHPGRGLPGTAGTAGNAWDSWGTR
jgi:phage terminase large subunit